MVLWEDTAPLKQNKTSPRSHSMMPCRTKSRHWPCSAPWWHKEQHGWVIPKVLPPVPYCWNVQLSCLGASWEKHVAPSTGSNLCTAPSSHWCTTSPRRGDRREGAKVQPTIGVTRGQWGGAGRRSFQVVFSQIKGVLCCSLLILSPASISKVKHFLNSAHLHPKTVRCGMWSQGEHGAHGSILQPWPDQSVFSHEHTLWIKQEMNVFVCLMERRLPFQSLHGNKPWKKRECTEKVLNCLLQPSGFLCLPWGCRGSSIGFQWFSWCVGCSLSLCFSIGMSPSKPFTLILFHQLGGKKKQLKGS